MKLAFAGKGGVGKTSMAAWTGDRLARLGRDVWLIDADTALSLGEACGLSPSLSPEPLSSRAELIRDRIHAGGFLNLNPDVGDLPGELAVDLPVSMPDGGPAPGRKRLLVMGGLANAGGGCACDANALLKAVLAHLVMETGDCVLVDLEAGVEHLGRGTAAHVDGLCVVTEPGLRSLGAARQAALMARELGLANQVLALNRHDGSVVPPLPGMEDLPEKRMAVPLLPGLASRQLTDGCVLDLPERPLIDRAVDAMLGELGFGDLLTQNGPAKRSL